MKTPVQIDALLEKFEKKFKFNVRGHAQLSEIWFQLRLGVITASNASRAVAKRDTETRATYMAELIADVCTGVVDEFSSPEMEWGRQHEDSARSYYEFASNVRMQPLPFVFMDESFRVGCSPDGIVSDRKGAEIKCPWNSANYVKFLLTDKIKPEWQWQQQFTLWVMDAEEWDFVQFDPRMKKSPMKIMRTEIDPEKQAVFDDLIPAFIADMDALLAKVGVKFGDHWARLGVQEGTGARP